MAKTKLVELEVSTKLSGKCKLWFVERFDMINRRVELRAVCSNYDRAFMYKEHLLRVDRENEIRSRVYIEERILDHLFGDSMTQAGSI